MATKTTKKATTNKTQETKKEFKLNQVLALWKQKSKNGTSYYTGTAEGEKVVAFLNGKKKNPKEPDIRVYRVDSEGKAEKDEFISLWAKVSKKGTKYLSGKLEDKYLTGFIRNNDNEKAPYITVYYSEDLNKDSEEQEATAEPVDEADELPFDI